MNKKNSDLQSTVIPTHNIDIALPANTKYLSGNHISRLLIQGFMQTLVDLIGQVHSRDVLDVGCGEGLISRQLHALWNDIQIHGVDISLELLDAAQRVAPGVNYLAGSVFQLPLASHCYDLVICTEVLEHLESPYPALLEIARVSNGYCLLSVPNEPWWRLANMLRGSYWGDWGNTPGHVNHWGKKEFVRFVDCCLDIVAIQQPFPWTIVLGKTRREPW